MISSNYQYLNRGYFLQCCRKWLCPRSRGEPGSVRENKADRRRAEIDFLRGVAAPLLSTTSRPSSHAFPIVLCLALRSQQLFLYFFFYLFFAIYFSFVFLSFIRPFSLLFLSNFISHLPIELYLYF